MKTIEEHIREILSRQERFEVIVKELQQYFYEELLKSYTEITINPNQYNAVFTGFQRYLHQPVIELLAQDVLFIILSNEEYFSDIAGKEISAIITSIEKELMELFGLNSPVNLADSIIRKEGYFADVLQDTSIKRDVRAFLAKQANSNIPLPVKHTELRSFIVGDSERQGLIESYYNRTGKDGASIFDLYQKADRYAQNEFSTKLGLQAARYIGGIIEGSRPFCRERNGKIYLRSEIEAWKELSFQGKPAVGYEPILDCGGYRCRHHLIFITNATAMRLDSTLKENEQGVLYRLAV